jgi:predicted enzyme related to lactoylglutathione lyase
MATQSPFVWYEFMSNDVAASKAFYSRVVGWSTEDVPMPGMTYTLLRVGEKQVGGMMALPKEAGAAGMRPGWFGYIACDDTDRAAAKVKELGGRIFMPPTDIPNVGRFAMGADPQGAAFYLFKAAQPGERAVSREAGQISWNELHTTDWPKAFEFYSQMFGWLKGDSMDMGPMGTYQIFTIRGTPSGAMFNSPAAQTARYWLYYFNVDDIDEAVRRIGDAGGKVNHGPVEVPGGGWIVQASDPQGAAFAVLGSRK